MVKPQEFCMVHANFTYIFINFQTTFEFFIKSFLKLFHNKVPFLGSVHIFKNFSNIVNLLDAYKLFNNIFKFFLFGKIKIKIFMWSYEDTKDILKSLSR